MSVNLPHTSSLHKDVKVQELSFKPTNLATSSDGLLRSNWGDLHSPSSVFSDFVFFHTSLFFSLVTFFDLLPFSLILKVVIFISVLFLPSRVCAFRSSLLLALLFFSLLLLLRWSSQVLPHCCLFRFYVFLPSVTPLQPNRCKQLTLMLALPDFKLWSSPLCLTLFSPLSIVQYCILISPPPLTI